jgi:transposase
MDWTSIVLYDNKCPLGNYDYSRDHRPDKKQITLGVSELSAPINLPVGITVEKGNMNDHTQYKIQKFYCGK